MSEITYLHVLTAKTMLSNSNDWLNTPDIVQMIESHTLGPGVLTEVRGAHDQLASALGWRQRLSVKLLEMTKDITTQDGEHDRFLRMLYYVLTALIEGADSPGEAERYLSARHLLIPDGLAQTRYTYANEHGAVIEVQQRITPEVEQVLQQTVVAGRSLWEIYQRWITAGQRLGQLVKERSRLESSMLQSSEGPTHVREARQVWLRVVRMFISAVTIMDLPDDGWRQIFAPLRRDVVNALEALRERGESADPVPDEVPDEAPDDIPGEDAPEPEPEDLPEATPEPLPVELSA